MLIGEILITLVKNMSVIVTIAYVLSKNDFFNHIIARRTKYWKIYLSAFCIPISIAGTFLSLELLDALANIRSLGAIVGGIYGGPIVGILVGLISGLQRWSMGGFTAFACAVGVVSSGFIGGLYHRYRQDDKPSTIGAITVSILALLVEMGWVLLLSQPFDQAFLLVQIIILPMTISNALGVGIFINILEHAREEIEHVKAVQSRKALRIANQTLPYLRQGLDCKSAAQVVEIIYQETGVDAVAITNTHEILAFRGMGEDHHLPGLEVLTQLTSRTIKEGRMVVVQEKEDIGCHEKSCPLQSAVVVPLKIDQQVTGVVKLYRTSEKKISSSDIELARGISTLLSNQMEIARLTEQAQLTVEAELKALQSQINPHFLFNSINTTVSYCRTEPMKARRILLKLAEVFRYTLRGKGYLATLEEEVQLVRDYMEIEQARFGDRIQLTLRFPDDLLDLEIPRLSLQPLVENAVRHGVSKISEPGKICIKVRREGMAAQITVQDNGVGIDDEKIDKILHGEYADHLGIGLANVNKRLQNIYGMTAKLSIKSQVGVGTEISFLVPLEKGRFS